ncbi:hypothetical protein UFOVP236_27 [uncultured Caudovirales phage]|uniref:Uncharacterized protein n=1 Tax=uncultured Caudovirales phage TaxID=2100421 RepID=A0A6J7WRB4_9CAUD|nr:hypothetical protein UFOVP236_27 [uncultured Caudovirales phage]
MPTIPFRVFSGVIQAANPELLQPNQAQKAVNTKLIYGDLRPWKQPLDIVTPTKSGVKKTIYRFGENETSESNYWFTWNTDVDVVRAPLDNDITERTYYTGDGYPKVTNNARALTGGTAYPINYYRLGVPPPLAVGVTLTVTGAATSATAVKSSVAYVITYVSSQGEESSPSAATDIADFAFGQTVTLNNLPTGAFTTQFASWNNIDVATKRIYRSNSGSKGVDFQFVAEIPLSQTTYADTKDAAELQEVVETWDWLPAPADMVGLKLMANGIGIGFYGNTLYPSEPFVLYAYPIAYRISTEYPIVGLGAFGQSMFVGTKGNPYVIQGTDPSSLTMTKLEAKQACVSKRSIVEMGGGVLYASPDGLCRVDMSGLSILTSGIINRDDWQLLNPASMIGCELDTRYYAFYDNGTEQGCLVFDFGAVTTFTKIDMYATAAFNDRQRDALYLAIGSKIVKFDYGSSNMTMTWKSKRFRSAQPVNFGAAKLGADSYPVTLRVYINGSSTAKYSINVSSEKDFKLPGGFKSDKWEFEISSADKVNYLIVSDNIKGIKQLEL